MFGRARGDEAAFDALYRSTWPRAVASARRIVHDVPRAEELAQEAFTRAFDRWPTVSAHPAPDAWVLRVTLNLAIDAVRRRRVELAPPESHDPEAATIAALQVRQALTALPKKQRQAIALRYLAQCEEAEIADAMGCGRGTVKTHLKRGMATLRAQLGVESLSAMAEP